MNETELECLVVRLMGDASSFEQMIDDAQKSAKEASSTVEDALDKVEAFGKGATSAVEDAIPAFAQAGQAIAEVSKAVEDMPAFETGESREQLQAMAESAKNAADALAEAEDAATKAAAKLAEAQAATNEVRNPKGVGGDNGSVEKMSSQAEELIATLAKQSATFGMTANEVKLYELAMSGASQLEMDMIRLAQQQVAALEEQAEAIKSAAKEQENMRRIGEQVTAAVTTAEENYAAKIAHTKGLLDAGVISQETFNRSLANAKAALQSTQTQIEQTTVSVKDLGTALTSALAVFGAKQFLGNAVGMFAETETLLVRLKASIEANGGAVEGTMNRYREFATQMKDTTGTLPDQTLKLLQLANTYGLSGEAAVRATKAAIALSASQEGSAEHFIMVGKAVEEGNAHMLHHIPALRGITGESEKLAKAQELIDKGMKVAESMTGTYEGTLKRFSGTVAALTKQFGETVADGMKPLYEWATKILKQFTDLDPTTKKIIVVAASLVSSILAIGPALAAVNGYVGPFVKLMTYGFTLIGPLIGTILNPIKLIGVALSALSGLIGLVFSPVGLAIGAIIGFVMLLVGHLGGLKETWNVVKVAAVTAWDWIKTKGVETWQTIKESAEKFWAWVQPAVEVLKVVFGVAWEAIKEGAAIAWAWIKDTALPVWESLRSSTVSVWNNIRSIIDGFIKWASPGFVAFVTTLSIAWYVISETVQTVWDIVVSIYETSIGQIVKWTTSATQATGDFIQKNSDVASVVIGVAAAIVVLVGAYQAVTYAVGIANSILTYFKIQQIIGIGLWAAWQAAIWLANIPVMVFNASLAVMGFLLGTNTGVSIAAGLAADLLSLKILIAKAAVWLFNVALTATNILAGAATFVVLAAGFVFVGAAVYAAYITIESLVESLSKIPTTTGPIKAVTEVFKEWSGILQDVVRAAKTDMPLAWEIVKAGAKLAVEQVKQWWPPLWTYIKEGFNFIWQESGHIFVENMRHALDVVAIHARYHSFFNDYENNPAFIAAMEKASGASKAIIKQHMKDLDILLAQAMDRFNTAVAKGDNPAVMAARAEVDRLRDLIKDAVPFKTPELINSAAAAGAEAGNKLTKEFKDHLKVDNVLRFSTEALSRISEQRDKLAGGNATQAGLAKLNVPNVVVPPVNIPPVNVNVPPVNVPPGQAPQVNVPAGQPGAPGQPAPQAVANLASVVSAIQELSTVVDDDFGLLAGWIVDSTNTIADVLTTKLDSIASRLWDINTNITNQGQRNPANVNIGNQVNNVTVNVTPVVDAINASALSLGGMLTAMTTRLWDILIAVKDLKIVQPVPPQPVPNVPNQQVTVNVNLTLVVEAVSFLTTVVGTRLTDVCGCIDALSVMIDDNFSLLAGWIADSTQSITAAILNRPVNGAQPQPIVNPQAQPNPNGPPPIDVEAKADRERTNSLLTALLALATARNGTLVEIKDKPILTFDGANFS